MSLITGNTPHIPLFDSFNNVIWIPADNAGIANDIVKQMEEHDIHSLWDWYNWQQSELEYDDPDCYLEYIWACEDMGR